MFKFNKQKDDIDCVYAHFNKALKAFIKDLNKNFTNTSVFKLLLMAFKIAKRLNKKMPQKMFHKYISNDYEAQIVARDLAYFTSEAFNISFWKELTVYIKTVGVQLDAENIKAIWDHMAVLIALERKCVCVDQYTDTDVPDLGILLGV